MKLKNFLGIADSNIVRFLIDNKFFYCTDDNYNYVRRKEVYVGGEHVWSAIISIDLDNYKLDISRSFVNDLENYINEDKYIEIDIPKELIDEDDYIKFIDWLDETCEPYFD